MAQKRIQEIPILESLLCFMVIFIHISSEAVIRLPKGGFASACFFIASRSMTFVVPGFLFSSALKFAYKYRESRFHYKPFWVQRLKKIFLPYVLWVVAYYYYFWTKDYYPFQPRQLVQYILDGTLVAHLYFVVILFQMYLLAPLWIWMGKQKKPLYWILAALLITCFAGGIFQRILPENSLPLKYGDRILTAYLLYWVCGIFCGIYYEKFRELLARWRWYLIAISVLCASVFVYFAYLDDIQVYLLPHLNVLKVVFSILCTLAFYAFCCKMAVLPEKAQAFFRGVNRISYTVYLSHCIVLFWADDMLLQHSVTSLFQRFLIRAVIVYAGSLLLNQLYWKGKQTILQRIKSK